MPIFFPRRDVPITEAYRSQTPKSMDFKQVAPRSVSDDTKERAVCSYNELMQQRPFVKFKVHQIKLKYPHP